MQLDAQGYVWAQTKTTRTSVPGVVAGAMCAPSARAADCDGCGRWRCGGPFCTGIYRTAGIRQATAAAKAGRGRIIGTLSEKTACPQRKKRKRPQHQVLRGLFGPRCFGQPCLPLKREKARTEAVRPAAWPPVVQPVYSWRVFPALSRHKPYRQKSAPQRGKLGLWRQRSRRCLLSAFAGQMQTAGPPPSSQKRPYA